MHFCHNAGLSSPAAEGATDSSIKRVTHRAGQVIVPSTLYYCIAAHHSNIMSVPISAHRQRQNSSQLAIRATSRQGKHRLQKTTLEGKGRMMRNKSDRMKHYRGSSSLVFRPRNAAKVSSIMKYFHDEFILGVVPQESGNTGLCGSATLMRDEIVL